MPRLIPLIIGPVEQAALADLVTRAAASPTDHKTLVEMAAATPKQADRLREMNRGLTIKIPTAFSVTLTYEEQQPGIMCRHASFSVRTGPGRSISPEAVRMLMDALGFKNLGAIPGYLETLADGTTAINVIEPLDGDLRRLENLA